MIAFRQIVAASQRWLALILGTRLRGSGFEGHRYLTKWLLLGTAIGLIAGIGAVLFAKAIDLATRLFLGGLVQYTPPSPVGEGNPIIMAFGAPWMLPVSLALGGLLSGILVYWLAPEAEGHGTDAAIASIHYHSGRVRARIPPIKLIASAITIGSGGSGGREGPTAQISAGFGSLLTGWLSLGPADRRIAVAAGMGAGIGAIFRAPLGGAVMASEILYIHDLEIEALLPALMASIVGYTVFGALAGFEPIFGNQPQLGLEHPLQLIYYALLGIFCGLGGLLYAKTFYSVTGLFHRLRLPNWLKPAIGGALVGLIGLIIPQALHTGYGWIQIDMTREVLGLPFWLVLLLPFAKILATSLSIGSGGSGGIFGPGMVIGGAIGAAFWLIGQAVLPQMPATPASFVIVGMMATFGGIAHAPLAVMLMVAEMTGNLSLLAPAMIAVAIATALVGDHTIYRSQLPNRASSPAHRARFSFPLLTALTVRDAIAPASPLARTDMPVSAVAASLLSGQMPGIAVVDERGNYAGCLLPDSVRQMPPDQIPNTLIKQIMRKDCPLLTPDLTLDMALEQLADSNVNWAPVINGDQLSGWLSVQRVVQTYKTMLERSVRRVRGVPPLATLLEFQLAASSPLIDKTLRDAPLPSRTLVVSINREGEVIFPRADTRLQAGDVVTIMADSSSEQAVRAMLGASASAHG